MSLLSNMNDPQRAARARMEAAERAARREAGIDAAGKPQPRQPQRYKLYDRIKDKVSVTTMNVIIGATALLLIIALIVGIATGNPSR
jgi:hypothetical protein